MRIFVKFQILFIAMAALLNASCTVNSSIGITDVATDGSADASAAIQQAIDRAAAKGGGTVRLGVGRYRLDKPLSLPKGVSLVGVWEGPHYAELDKGTVIDVYADKGKEDKQALIYMYGSNMVKGITFFYPEQRVPGVIAYPATLGCSGINVCVEDCTFINSYKAIDFASGASGLHYINNCYGCPLKLGVAVSSCFDVGRIENVHFNPHIWMACNDGWKPEFKDLKKYLLDNLVAFEFGRTDWEYVYNTFCRGAKVGYRFFETNEGTVNGNFLGIGADWCRRAVLVEKTQPWGLLITNGEFVGSDDTDTMVEVVKDHAGVVQFSNCSFWGPCQTVATLDGKPESTVSFNQCNFKNGLPDRVEPYALDVRSGSLIVQGCRFAQDGPDIKLSDEVQAATIFGNWFMVSKEIDNKSKGDVQEGLNVVFTPPAADE